MIIPNMLLVGSTARNTGKTTFCTEFIHKWRELNKIVGVKITTIHDENCHCHHGENGCGACTSFRGDYEIVEEVGTSGNKDTSDLLRAGANKVYWVRAKKWRLAETAERVMAMISNDAVVVCESNSLSEFVSPGAIVVTNRRGIEDIKPSALPMLEKADFIVDISEPESLKTALDSISVEFSENRVRLTSKSN